MRPLSASELAFLSLPLASNPPTHSGLVYFPYDIPGPAHGRNKPLTKTNMLPQQGIKHPLHLHGGRLPLLPDILAIPICVQFASLGLVYGGVYLGPTLVPCLLQFSG